MRTAEELNASAQQVWSFIGDFGGLQQWHPAVRSCKVQGSGIGSVRYVELDGWYAVERLTQYDASGFVLGYEMVDCGKPQLIGVRGTVQLEPIAADRSRIVWLSEMPADAPAELEPLLRAYYPARIAHLRAALAAAT